MDQFLAKSNYAVASNLSWSERDGVDLALIARVRSTVDLFVRRNNNRFDGLRILQRHQVTKIEA